MSTTSGNFNVQVQPDIIKASASHYVAIPAAGTAQVINPVAGVNALTVFNTSAQWVRGTVTFAAGVTLANGATAATQVFVVPPQASYSADWSSNSALVGDIPAIESVSFVAIAAPAATAEVSTVAALAANATASFAVNFAQN